MEWYIGGKLYIMIFYNIIGAIVLIWLYKNNIKKWDIMDRQRLA
jgi:hypothetical protein